MVQDDGRPTLPAFIPSIMTCFASYTWNDRQDSADSIVLTRSIIQALLLKVQSFGCPTLAAFLFLRLGWDTRGPLY